VLAVVLAKQAGVSAPTSLASSVTGVALAGANAVGVGADAGSGIAVFFGGGKTLALVSGAVAILAGGAAVSERMRTHDAEAALALAEQQRHEMQLQVDDLSTRLTQAERRAAEAEKDSGELLKAIDGAKPPTAASLGQKNTVAPPPNGDPQFEDERVVRERAYLQELARERAADARVRAKVEQEAAQLDPVHAFDRLIALAEDYLAKGDFQGAIRAYNRAMAMKPPELPISERVRQLQIALRGQNVPVDVTFISDGNTWVSITNIRQPEKFDGSKIMKLLPGDYVVLGRRKGYRDVALTLHVRGDAPPPTLTVICTESAGL
jgi:tetratricopeptide (TPR) repeat protein